MKRLGKADPEKPAAVAAVSATSSKHEIPKAWAKNVDGFIPAHLFLLMDYIYAERSAALGPQKILHTIL